MKLIDLETEFRRLVDDEQSQKYLWSPDEARRYANEAQVDAIERGELIEDETTSEVCQITVRADTPTYDLHGSVLRVLRAKLDSQGNALRLTDRNVLERRHLQWDTTSGTPWAAIDQTTEIRLVWIPKADDVLRLIVKRLPLCKMVKPDDRPEIHDRYHDRLLDGMLARAYMKRDTETYNPNKAAYHEKLFTMSFGERRDANVARKRRDRRLRVTRPTRYV